MYDVGTHAGAPCIVTERSPSTRFAMPGGKAFSVLDSRSKEIRKILSVSADVIGPPRLSRDGTAYFSRAVTEADVWIATLK